MNRRNDIIVGGRRIQGGLRRYVFAHHPEKQGSNADTCSKFLVQRGWVIVTEYLPGGREIRTHVEPGCTTNDWRLPAPSQEVAADPPETATVNTTVPPPLAEPEVIIAIRMLRFSQALLKSQGVLRNQKDFTSQLGEYVVLELFGGELATSGIQEGWDLMDANGLKVQVKSHAKAESTMVKSTPFNYTEKEFDDLCIVRFTPNYSDVVIHRLSFEDALGLVTNGTISWSALPQAKLVYEGPLCADIDA